MLRYVQNAWEGTLGILLACCRRVYSKQAEQASSISLGVPRFITVTDISHTHHCLLDWQATEGSFLSFLLSIKTSQSGVQILAILKRTLLDVVALVWNLHLKRQRRESQHKFEATQPGLHSKTLSNNRNKNIYHMTLPLPSGTESCHLSKLSLGRTLCVCLCVHVYVYELVYMCASCVWVQVHACYRTHIEVRGQLCVSSCLRQGLLLFTTAHARLADPQVSRDSFTSTFHPA